VKLSDRLKPFFPAGVRTKGEQYAREDRVVPLPGPADELRATVRGTYDYRVRLRVGAVVGVSCSCDDSADSVCCKHLWAMILKAEAWGADAARRDFGAVRDVESLDDEAEPEAEAKAAAAALPDSDPRRRRNTWAAATDETGPRGSGRGSAWRQMIEQVRHLSVPTPPPPPPAEGFEVRPAGDDDEFVYVVETATCLSQAALVLGLRKRTRKRDGAWGKLRPHGFHPDDARLLTDPIDRRIFRLVTPPAPAALERPAWYSRQRTSEVEADPDLRDALLAELDRSGRWMYLHEGDGFEVPLVRDTGGVWNFRLRLGDADDRGSRRLVGELERAGELKALDEPLLLLGGAWRLVFLRDGDRVLACDMDDHGAFAWISRLRAGGAPRVKANEVQPLLTELAGLRTIPPLELPAELGWNNVADIAPVPHLVITPSHSGVTGPLAVSGTVEFDYQGRTVASDWVGDLLVDAPNKRLIRRDAAAEQRRLRELGQAGFARTGTPADRLPEVVHALGELGWTVSADRKPFRTAGEFKAEIVSGIDWFEVTGGIDFDGAVLELPQLLAAVKRGDRLVTLGDGSIGMLPEKWLASNGLLLELGRQEDNGVRFSRAQLGLLDAMLAGRPQVTFDDTFAIARDKLRAFDKIAEAEAPAGFQGELRPYQKLGLGWLRFLQEFGWGGCLADDMGLGKTVQVLALLAQRKIERPDQPSLAIVPKSVVFNWIREAERFTPSLRVLNYTGMGRKDVRKDFGEYDLILTTYGTLRQDVTELARRVFDYVILDEAQSIKNVGSQSAKAARLLQAHHRLAMSGTPVENHLGELWSIFEFLNPGMLGARERFLGQYGGGTAEDAELDLLRRTVRPFLLRRTKEQVASDLPAKVEQTIECELPEAQRQVYNELREHYRASVLGAVKARGLSRSKIVVLEALLRLRQAACHPGLIDPDRKDMETAKFEALLPMIEEVLAEDHKILVFSQFVSLLDLLRAELDKRKMTYEYLDGKTRDRAAVVDRFQNEPTSKLFLISLKAGGLGLNLTAADYVFILDPWWNPAVEAQAVDRAHRIGQMKRVFAYRLIARDTVEEKIAELQKRKKELADSIVSADEGVIRSLTREDLEMLLS